MFLCAVAVKLHLTFSSNSKKNGFWYLVLKSRGQLIKFFYCKNARSEFLKQCVSNGPETWQHTWSIWRGRQRTWIFLQVLTKPESSMPSLLCHTEQKPQGFCVWSHLRAASTKWKPQGFLQSLKGHPPPINVKMQLSCTLKVRGQWPGTVTGRITELARLTQCGTLELVLKQVICLSSMWLIACCWHMGPTSLMFPFHLPRICA